MSKGPRPIVALAAGCAMVCGIGSAQAAISYDTAGAVHEQDFNDLASTGTANPWTNNSTLPGFYLFNSGASSGATGRDTDDVDNVAPANWRLPDDYRSSGGSSSRIYAFGHATVNPTDRALGSIAGSSSTQDAGDFFYALVFQNNTGQTLNEFTLSYTGEQWFDQFNTTAGNVVGPHTLGFSYLIKDGFDAQADVPTQGDFGDYTEVPELSFSSPNTGNTSTSQVIALNGNEEENRTSLSQSIDVNWAAGDYLILRFWDDDNNGNDQPHAIDDLSFSAAVPEPASAVAGVTLALSLLTARRRRRAIADNV